MPYLKASEQGLAKIKQARELKGWTVENPRWLIEASKVLEPNRDWETEEISANGVSLGTWRAFLDNSRKKGISTEVFKAYCTVLGLPWSEIVKQSSDTQENLTTSSSLLEFCRRQVSSRMCRLRSDDLYSGKKYIPSLYIDRKQAREDLEKYLFKEDRRILLLIGIPQVGKTNFICHTVQELVDRGVPCLFYPAIDVNQGLLEEISEDLRQFTLEEFTPWQLINNFSSQCLKQLSQKLIIFIDGWNEASQSIACAIDRQSDQLSKANIKVIISLTNVSASRLLKDKAGNPSYVAEAASIDSYGIPLIEMNPDKRGKDSWSTVHLARYTHDEKIQAYRKYAEAYKVCIPVNHDYVDDPLILRIGMQFFSGCSLPEVLDEPQLLEQSINHKISRTIDLDSDSIFIILTELANKIFLQDAPISQIQAVKIWNLLGIKFSCNGIFEAAILAKVRDMNGLPSIDFYFSRERDFILAYWSRNWHIKAKNDLSKMIIELYLTVKTQAGTDAIKWFFRQPNNVSCLQRFINSFVEFKDKDIRKILLSSLGEVLQRIRLDENWILSVIEKGIVDPEPLVQVEAVKILALCTEDYERVAEVLAENTDLIPKLLEIEEDYPLDQGSIGRVVLDALREIHDKWIDDADDYCHSEITLSLEPLLRHQSQIIRIAAAKALGYLYPIALFESISKNIYEYQTSKQFLGDYVDGIYLAIRQLEDDYYGYMCRGYLSCIEDSPVALCEEYRKMYSICIPVANLYKSHNCSKIITDLLRDLHPAKELPSYTIVKATDFVSNKLQEKVVLADRNELLEIARFGARNLLCTLNKLIELDKIDDKTKIKYSESIVYIAQLLQEEFKRNYNNFLKFSSYYSKDNDILNDYKEVYYLALPVIDFYYPDKSSSSLLDLLKDFEYTLKKHFQYSDTTRNLAIPSVSDLLAICCQLPLPFEKFE
jgi:hypothetical protein